METLSNNTHKVLKAYIEQLDKKDSRIKDLEDGLRRLLHESSGYRSFLKDKYLERFQAEFEKAKQLLNPK